MTKRIPSATTTGGAALAADELQQIDAFWRACNYLAASMTYPHWTSPL